MTQDDSSSGRQGGSGGGRERDERQQSRPTSGEPSRPGQQSSRPGQSRSDPQPSRPSDSSRSGTGQGTGSRGEEARPRQSDAPHRDPNASTTGRPWWRYDSTASEQERAPSGRGSDPDASRQKDAGAGTDRSEPPPDDDEAGDETGTRHRLERMLRETVRRGLERGFEAGLGTISRSEKAIRGVVGGDLPREVVQYVFTQVDETKNALVRVVAREVRDFLEATDIAQELQRALTSLSFEVKTEIRFIPNDSGGVRPNVRARSTSKRRRKASGEEEVEESSSEQD